MDELWNCTWETGPDAGVTTALQHPSAGWPDQRAPSDRHWSVGRAADADVRCDDPTLEPHHALLGIGDDGCAWVMQVAGRAPLTVDGTTIDEATALTDGTLIEIGHSSLRFRRAVPAACAPAHIREGAVVRGPRVVPRWEPVGLVPPAAPDGRHDLPGGMLPALIGLAGAGVLAAVMHQPMFLMFGALGALVAGGSWLAQRLGSSRRTRRTSRAHRWAVAEFHVAEELLRSTYAQHVLANSSTAAIARDIVERLDHRLWARRAADGDAFAVALGAGEHDWRTPLAAAAGTVDRATAETGPAVAVPLRDLPMVVDLLPGTRMAVRGSRDRTRGLARSLVLQLAAQCGPADVRIVVVTNEPSAWQWAVGLPHLGTAQGENAVFVPAQTAELTAAVDQPGGPHLLIVTDAPELLAARTSSLRRAVTGERSPALIALVAGDAGVPHVCRSVLTMAATPVARWVVDSARSSLPQSVRTAGMSASAAAAMTARLALLTDPDDPFAAGTGLPPEVGLLTLLALDDGAPVSPASVAARWLAGGNDPNPRAPIGTAADGLVDIDLVRDGPHGLIAGTTGSGKSELLRSLVVAMAVGASPDHLTFVLVDYKGGATFDACATLPHVVGVVTDLDDHLADRALRSLHAELRRREQVLRQNGAADLTALREVAPGVVLPRLVVVIDEFAALVVEQPAFLHALVGVAQRGRSLGMHLLLATQRPSGVISDDIRANTNIRIALRLHDTSDAVDVVGDASPTLIRRRTPGRTVMRLGPEEFVTFQSARCTGPAPGESGRTELDQVVRAVREAAQIVGMSTPTPPWQPPLPTVIEQSDLAALCASLATPNMPDPSAVMGLLDDPDRQRVLPLTWEPGRGHLLLAGAPGSGVTSALVALGERALRGNDPAHLYIVDAIGDDALSRFEQAAGCAGVVRLHERERLMRLLLRLAEEVDRRATSGGARRAAAGGPELVLLIDGFLMLRRSLDDLDTAPEFEALDRILSGGPAAGITVVLSVGQATAMPPTVAARCSERWVFHLTDPLDGSTLGVAAATVPADVPGRIVVVGGPAAGLEGQLALPPTPAVHCRLVENVEVLPEPIDCVPAVLDGARLPGGWHADSSTWLPLGPAFATAGLAVLEVPDGEHLMVIGPARSGRSRALARLVIGWRQAHPDGWCAVLTPRRSIDGPTATHRSLAGMLADLATDVAGERSVLLAIDDADVVDDTVGERAGTLAAMAATRRPGLLIAAVGKPDALRQTYGHWTTVVRRSRLGLITSAANDLDGDLLGAALPRRMPVPARPGLVWLVDNGSTRLVQLGLDAPAPSTTDVEPARPLGSRP